MYTHMYTLMKRRLEAALDRYPVGAWSEAREANRARLLQRLAAGTSPVLTCLVYNWQPNSHSSNTHNSTRAFRAQARPRQRWH